MPVGDDDLVLMFRRVGDRVQVIRRNIRYKAPAGTPLDKAVKQNYTDSVLMALPIQALNMMRGGAVLVDLSDTKPSPPGVFLVSDGVGHILRHCEIVAQKQPVQVRLSANNRNYEAYTAALDKAGLIGRVIAKLQWL